MKRLLIIATIAMVGCGESKIDTSCSMNGHGDGKCIFTNLGNATGSVCGKIVVNDTWIKKTEQSNVFCSGEVPPSSSKEMQFFVPNMKNTCGTENTGFSWSDRCNFDWNKH